MSVFRFQATDTSTPVSRRSRNRGSKSPPSFAFSTSPSILQDITMDKTSPCPSPNLEPKPVSDNNFVNEDALVMVESDLSSFDCVTESDDDSLGEMDARGATGLTMKEYDENLKKLTAENFQLKLKIYFLNERIAKIGSVQDKNIVNENIELKVDNEQKAQEVERQSKLLTQALEVIEQLQNDHQLEIKRLIAAHEVKISDAHVRTEALETQIRLLQESAELIIGNAQTRDIQGKLQETCSKVKELEYVNNELKTKCENFEKDAEVAQTLDDERKSFLVKIKSYEDELTKLRNPEAALKIDTKKCDELEAELASQTAELAALQATHDRACATIKSFVRRVVDERNENERLEGELKEARLKIELLDANENDSLILQKMDCQCGVKTDLARISELQDEVNELGNKPGNGPDADLTDQLRYRECEMETVKNDLKKRTHFLQELVNKELWDKNRQIEKLEKKLVADDVGQLKKEIEILKAEKLRLTGELAENQEKDVAFKDACFILTKRLEELAGFLDSLITNRSLVQFDGETYNAIKRAVDCSRELSRRLTMSYSELTSYGQEISAAYFEDEVLAGRRESEPLTLDVRECEKQWLELEIPDVSDDEKRTRTANGIRKRVEKFCSRALAGNKGEMDASESEAWSEPDRSVSLARMGRIDSISVTPLRLSKSKNSSGSSEETLNETGQRPAGKRTRSVDSETRKLVTKVKTLEDANKDLKEQLILLENKHVILSKLNGHSTPQLFLEMSENLIELDETRQLCQRLKSDLAAGRGDFAIAQQDLEDKTRVCDGQKDVILKMQSKIDGIVMDYELRIREMVTEKETAEKRASAMAETLAVAEKLRVDLEQQVVDINKKFCDAQSWQNQSKAQVKEAGRHLDSCEKILLEKVEYEKKIRELQKFVECLEKTVEEKQSEVDSWVSRAQREHDEMTDLKRRLLETERSKTVVESKIKEEGERIKWMDEKLRELEQAMDQCERENEAKIVEEVGRRLDFQLKEAKKEWVLRVDLERAHKNIEQLEYRLKTSEKTFKEQGDYLVKKLNRIETEKRDWWRQMNDIRLRGSEMEVELTRLANENVRLEEELKTAVGKHEKAETTIRNLQKQTEYESCASGYTPGSVNCHDFLTARNLNSSPDLGIESDQGRFSSLEHQDLRPLRIVGTNVNRLEAENEELKQQLEKLSRNLEETAAELATANYQKKQMERAICKQLHKTHHMLKKARRNFEPDSDSVDDLQ